MNTLAEVALTSEQCAILQGLLGDYLPGSAAWIYGSRVNGHATARSDLDMVVFASADQRRQISDLREALEESNLPFRVDLFSWDEAPESFKANIEKESVCLTK
ncbi:hypothetical protein FACS189441_8240 [Betaproteobacteria bacterium]|nr:hypothetical protein FACS189441_8240 [Betaproteobacteria bacterium]